MTLREALTAGSRTLAANPDLRDCAGRDAEVLLLHQLGLAKAQRYAEPDRLLSEEEQACYRQALSRRLLNEPVQYITGQQEFYGKVLRVSPAVLIPRPETEHLVEAVLERLAADRPLRLLDVGTGSGAIALALAAHLPQAQITAVDLSPSALRVAEANARDHGLERRITFVVSDLLAALGGQTFDCIVSNPPYVPTGNRASLHPQVRDHEPAQALFAGPDGLYVYRRLVPTARAALIPGGLLALEIGHGQQTAMAALLKEWEEVSFRDDLQGIPRVALARRPA